MTRDEIKKAARDYYKRMREEDKAEGYGVDDLRYVDLKYAFIAGVEWVQSKLVHKPQSEDGITSAELTHQIYGYQCAAYKAKEFLKNVLAAPMPDDEYQKWADEKLEEFYKTVGL